MSGVTCHQLTHQEFKFFFKQSKKKTSEFFTVLYKANHQENARLGLIISKKFIKRSVDRNRLKRVIRESFRLHRQSLKGLDILVLIRSECSTLDKSIWRKDIDDLWQKLTIF